MTHINVEVSPSLALIKYWGKKSRKKNIPATSSLAVTLSKLRTATKISLSDTDDSVTVNGDLQKRERYTAFFSAIRRQTGKSCFFCCDSTNNFPTAAGLASSASGFAALALGIGELLAPKAERRKISAWARLGSASAARAVYGGVTILRRGSLYAEPLQVSDLWKNARILAVCTSTQSKPVSSREAMELCRQTSPFYKSWLNSSEKIFKEAVGAMQAGDMELLGELMQMSYLQMFSTMFSAFPPVLYWLPKSVAVIHLCRELRSKGIPAWETMDAGPQVKILTDSENSAKIKTALLELDNSLRLFEDKVGTGPVIKPG